jgi:hypothetical protein
MFIDTGPCGSVAASSAEPIREKTVVDFCAAFAACGVRGDVLTPVYGSADTHGRPVQVDPFKPTLKAPETKPLKL